MCSGARMPGARDADEYVDSNEDVGQRAAPVLVIAVLGQPAPMRILVTLFAVERAATIDGNDVAHARARAAS